MPKPHPGWHCTACHSDDPGGHCPATPDGEHISAVQLGQGWPSDTTGARCTCAPRHPGGRPRKHVEPLVDLRVRLPGSLHRDLTASVAANPTPGWSLNDEVIARCTAARAATDQGAQS